MPPLETDCRNDKAVYWAANGFDKFGKEKVDAAVSIDVRFEIKKEKALDAQGNVIMIDANAVVDREIAVGSRMWMGNIDDIADPPVDLWEVRTNSNVPDIKGRNRRRVVGLTRDSNELPTLA